MRVHLQFASASLNSSKSFLDIFLFRFLKTIETHSCTFLPPNGNVFTRVFIRLVLTVLMSLELLHNIKFQSEPMKLRQIYQSSERFFKTGATSGVATGAPAPYSSWDRSRDLRKPLRNWAGGQAAWSKRVGVLESARNFLTTFFYPSDTLPVNVDDPTPHFSGTLSTPLGATQIFCYMTLQPTTFGYNDAT